MIRKAKKSDKEDIIEISKYSWENDYIPVVFDEWIEDKNSNFYVIEENKKVIGCGRMKELKTGIFWLEGLRVHKDYRNRGYGKKISEFFLKLAEEKKYKRLMFSTYIDNVESRHVMESYGFKLFLKYKWLYFKNNNNPYTNSNYFEVAKDFEEIKRCIFNSKEYYSSKGFISFDWIFVELDENLLKVLFERNEIYVYKENGKIESLIILSDYMQKFDTLFISFIYNDYEKAIDFAINKFLKTEKLYLSYMKPENLFNKDNILKKGFTEDDSKDNNVFLYVLE
ncbi:GNAT family N-acetyltransferase [Marinitoga arctica]